MGLSFGCTSILRIHVFIGYYTFDCSLGNWSHIELQNLFFLFRVISTTLHKRGFCYLRFRSSRSHENF